MNELESRLPEIIAALPQVIDKALEKGAEVIADAERQRVPVRTGRLRDSIHVERKSAFDYEIVSGDNEAWYGHLVEFGTSHSPPEPFAIPALEENREPVTILVHAEIAGL